MLYNVNNKVKRLRRERPEVRNLDIRVMVSESGLRYIDIAKQMGISRVWLSNLMRYDLTTENREKILKAIRELKGERDQ